MTRRSLLLSAALPAFSATGRPIRLGGPIYLKSDDPAELAAEHRRLGYSAAYCPKAEVTDSARVRSIADEFRRKNVVIAEVGAWVNMIDADAEKRRANMAYITSRLALAEAVGARCCVDIGGSYNPERWDGPDPRNVSDEYFDATVENCRKLIDAVRPKRTKFTIEMMWWALPDSADEYLRLIRAIDRPAFGVHVDVCNIIVSPRRFYRNSAIIREIFEKLGRW
ncbi:MAG: TIM barrel protein, partial [Acidobacteria bacterium]|nr:TIM barrel protein [Acidobacteriota bacterium]